MPALLIEIDFISNLSVENALRDDTYINDIANSISKSLLSFVNKPIVDEFTYLVFIGEFKDKDTAICVKNDAIAKGFNAAYIIHH